MAAENSSTISYQTVSPMEVATNVGVTTTMEMITSYVEYEITIIALAVYTTIGLLIVGCNSLNLFILRRPLDCFSDNTRFFFRALAGVDLMTGLVCCPTEMILAVYGNWPYTHLSCDIVAVIYTMMSCQSLLVLCCVSVDRFLCIIKPLRYPNLMTPRRARILLASALIIATLASLVILVARNLPSPDYTFKLCALLYLDSPVAARALFIIIFVSFFLPGIILLYVNIRLIVIIVQKTRELADMSPTAVKLTTDKLKGVRTILVVTSAFFVTWLPVVATIISKVVFNAYIPPALGTLVAAPALCNSWINAVIYLFMSRSYRATVMKELRKCFKKRRDASKWATNGSMGASAAMNSEAML